MMLTLSALLLVLVPAQGRQVVEPAPQAPAQQLPDQILTIHDAHDIMPKGMIPPSVSEALRESDLDEILVADIEKLIADRTAQDQIVQVIRTWVPIEPEAQLTATPEGMLLANMTLASHDELSRFLEVQRSGPRSYRVDLKLVEIPTNEVPADLLALDGPSPLNDEQTRIYRQQLATSPLTEELFAPTIKLLARQEFSISKMDQETYIADVSYHQDEASGVQTADPVVKVLQEGVLLRGRAVPLFGDRVGVEINLKRTDVERPMKTIELTPEFSTTPITLHLPELTITSAKAEISLDCPGSFVVLVPLDRKGGQLFLEGVVRPERLAPAVLEPR